MIVSPSFLLIKMDAIPADRNSLMVLCAYLILSVHLPIHLFIDSFTVNSYLT